MKYLKLFTESTSFTDEDVEDIEDIFQDIIDEYNLTDTSYYDKDNSMPCYYEKFKKHNLMILMISVFNHKKNKAITKEIYLKMKTGMSDRLKSMGYDCAVSVQTDSNIGEYIGDSVQISLKVGIKTANSWTNPIKFA